MLLLLSNDIHYINSGIITCMVLRAKRRLFYGGVANMAGS